jgi:hypothetical protein
MDCDMMVAFGNVKKELEEHVDELEGEVARLRSELEKARATPKATTKREKFAHKIEAIKDLIINAKSDIEPDTASVFRPR